MSNKELVRKMLSDECPPGKFCHALCHDTYSNEDGRRDDCIACWTAWVNENGLPERSEPQMLGDMTLRETRERCRNKRTCGCSCDLYPICSKLEDGYASDWENKFLDVPLNIDNGEDKC